MGGIGGRSGRFMLKMHCIPETCAYMMFSKNKNSVKENPVRTMST